MKRLNLERTRKAILEYEEGDDARTDMLRNAQDRAQVEAWEKAEAEALEKLRRAFLEDTSDRNTWSQVKVMDYRDIRQMFEKYG
jgi:hypothetical protein